MYFYNVFLMLVLCTISERLNGMRASKTGPIARAVRWPEFTSRFIFHALPESRPIRIV